ncbi:MAG: hypothetical protein H6706_26140 [Myxococcales bacterium]|nr:hypothetical protein [Myxococcales bacterium]
MEVLCAHCGGSDDRDGLEALPGGFGFTCQVCGEATILAPRDPAPRAAAPAPESGVTCPKCGHHQDDAEACHRCGLLFALAASGQVVLSDPLAGRPEAEGLRARWADLAGRLDDEAGHRAFIELCAAANALEFAGQCYRRLTPPGGEEDERVADYRQRVIKAAMARVGLLEQRALGRQSRLRGLFILTLAALIVLGFAIGYYLLTRHQARWQLNG